MKSILTAVLTFALMLGFAGCKKKSEGWNPDALGKVTAADSLLYYFGNIKAAQYWRDADADTSMRSRKNRDLYLKGLRDGLDAVAEDHGIYNLGMRDGVQMAINLYEFNKKYGSNLDRELLIQSVTYGLENDTIVDELHAQKKFYDLLSQLKKERRERMMKKAYVALPRKAAELHMRKLENNLYGKIEQRGKGLLVKEGDRVYLSINFTREDGSNLGLPSPEYLEVGAASMPPVMTRALCSMTQGETSRFATIARELFGTRCGQLGLKSSSVVFLLITVSDVVTSADIAEHDSLFRM